jgi:uncharacterized membrane protein YhaH (DUF805 family)
LRATCRRQWWVDRVSGERLADACSEFSGRRRAAQTLEGKMILPTIDPLIAGGVVVTTAFTDAVYVLFNAAVSARRRFAAATWSSVWYLLAAFAVISCTSNWAYVLFAALGSWIGGFLSITALERVSPLRRD